LPGQAQQETLPAGGNAAAPAAPPARLPAQQWAVFLDIDGTLIEFADDPRPLPADPGLQLLLRRLGTRSAGALALVSGRDIRSIDTIISPLSLPAAGLHGFERRSAAGVLSRHASPTAAALATARQRLAAIAARDDRLFLEDKGFALALHYRRVPELAADMERAAHDIARQSDGELELRPGAMVAELAPRGLSKAVALAEFMREQPFAGRQPLFVGDDLTDEPAFEWVNSVGGLSVAVNVSRPTAARTQLPSVGAVRQWLQALFDGAESRA
jgi:trehalose 6-phosphate phosphatase